ncbi:MAG: type II toxin-antitoxin system death-on-curing family toxin [Lachnospiraceae bacterium]|jgi:death-on-curing protein|nr:type II toxin-antitoxin system death-on-curing family toxin [Lachnospiraceae bacterium]
MIKLTREQVLAMQRALLDAHGGKAGIRDESLLDSALSAPFQTFGGQPLFLTIQQKAVRLGFGLITNHHFLDGNKRIGVHVMLTMLTLNGVELEYTQKELHEVIMGVAANEVSFEELLDWVFGHEIK